MTDEKKIKEEEITDERLNDAAGGIGETGWTSDSKKCATPGCQNTLPWNWGDTLCPTCRQAKTHQTRH